MKIKAIPSMIICQRRGQQTVTSGGIIKPQSAVEREQKEHPAALVVAIHPKTSEETGVVLGDIIAFHAAGGISHDMDYGPHHYIVVHKDNLVFIVEEEDGVIATTH